MKPYFSPEDFHLNNPISITPLQASLIANRRIEKLLEELEELRNLYDSFDSAYFTQGPRLIVEEFYPNDGEIKYSVGGVGGLSVNGKVVK